MARWKGGRSVRGCGGVSQNKNSNLKSCGVIMEHIEVSKYPTSWRNGQRKHGQSDNAKLSKKKQRKRSESSKAAEKHKQVNSTNKPDTFPEIWEKQARSSSLQSALGYHDTRVHLPIGVQCCFRSRSCLKSSLFFLKGGIPGAGFARISETFSAKSLPEVLLWEARGGSLNRVTRSSDLPASAMNYYYVR